MIGSDSTHHTNTERFSTRRVVRVAVLAALYAVLTWGIAPMSYGPIQFRVSEVLKVLVLFDPWLVLGIGIGTFLANLTSPFVGPWELVWMPLTDGAGGLLAWALYRYVLRRRWPLAPMTLYALTTGLAVGLMLWVFGLGGFWVLAGWVALSEMIILGGGTPLMFWIEEMLEKRGVGLEPAEDVPPTDADPLDLEAAPGHRSGFVAVIGRPNVGKSTLVNQLVGQKVAIVSPKPQTTRGRISGILTRQDAQVIFVDTPGLHRPRHTLGQVMVASATAAIPDADVVQFVVDASVLPTDRDKKIAALIREHTQAPIILVLNKMDLLPPDRVKLHTEAYWELVPNHHQWMMTTATQGVNLDKLLELLIAALPEGPRYYPGDQVTDQTEREIAAELIREQVLRHTRQEVPHAVAVVVEEFKERDNDVIYVAANVFVEKDSQKGIVIGKGGQMLRRIGTTARKEIERMAGGQIYLDLWVKVRKDWRRDEKELYRLGYRA